MVTDKDPDGGGKVSRNLNASMSDLESRSVMNDDAIWTDIVSKGLLKDNRFGWSWSLLLFNDLGRCCSPCD
jgi:hypothetical protein